MIRMPSNNQLWRLAIREWTDDGTAGRMQELLQADGPIPAFARAWLADVVAGNVKRKPGRKRTASRPLSAKAAYDQFAKEQAIRDAFRQACEHESQARAQCRAQGGLPPRDGTPSDKALAHCAQRFGMSVGNIKRVVYA